MPNIAVLLPFLALALLTHRLAWTGTPLREAMLTAAVLWGAGLTALTELLSLGSYVTRGAVLWGWLAACTLLALAPWKPNRPGGTRRVVPWSRFGWASLAGVASVGLVTLVIAVMAPPNSWDAMTYHLARVATWIQERSVAHFPTHTDRQLHHAPWAEFAILHLTLLAGSDWPANLVQWLGFAGSIAGISLVAGDLGGGPAAQGLAAAIAATLPMGILQASSTQTDAVVTLWLVATAHFALRARTAAGSRPDASGWLLAGTAWGLAVLTKATALVWGAPFLAWYGAGALRRGRPARLQRVLTAGLSAAILVNLGHTSRNLALFDSPFAPHGDESGRYEARNGWFNPAAVLSNLVRNASLHALTPVGRLNRAVTRFVIAAHALIGLDANDPRTTLEGAPYAVAGPCLDEDYAGNPLHALLFMACLAGLVIRRDRGGTGAVRAYAWMLAAGGGLFCLLIKWQPWNSRLHLPWFVLAAAPAAVLWTRWFPARAGRALALTLLVAALPWLVANRTRPLLARRNIFNTDRVSLMFWKRPDLQAPYAAVARAIAADACREVGLVARFSGADDWEYPLWNLLGEPAAGRIRIRHVGVTNASAILADRPGWHGVHPCLVVALSPAGPRQVVSGGHSYRPVRTFGPVRLLAPVGRR